MQELLNKIPDNLHEQSYDNYWPDFKLGPYAIFNADTVTVYNHPHYDHLKQTITWDQRFIGNTVILFENFPTAIVNLEMQKDYPTLYSILLHESFHHFQYEYGENRFPNEMLGFDYPTIAENIELRNKEREYLYKAVKANKLSEKVISAIQFIMLRESRRPYIEDYIEFEHAIESVEGTAWYIEMLAYMDTSEKSLEKVTEEFSKLLLDKNETALHVRASCYASGLFMCLLMDQLEVDWKREFTKSTLFLYDFFKDKLHFQEEPLVKKIKISEETEEIVELVNQDKANQIQSFFENKGHLVVLEGKVKICGFDPMNIVSFENRKLHKNFVRLQLEDQIFTLQQPVLIEAGNQDGQLRIQFFTAKPVVQEYGLLKFSFSSLKGELQEVAGKHYVRLAEH